MDFLGTSNHSEESVQEEEEEAMAATQKTKRRSVLRSVVASDIESSAEDDESELEIPRPNTSDEEDGEMEIPYAQAFDESQVRLKSALSDKKTEPLRPGDVLFYWHPTMVVGRAEGKRVAQVLQTDPSRDIPLELSTGDILEVEHHVQRVFEYKKNGKLLRHHGISRPIESFRIMEEGVASLPSNVRNNAEMQRQIEKYQKTKCQVKERVRGAPPPQPKGEGPSDDHGDESAASTVPTKRRASSSSLSSRKNTKEIDNNQEAASSPMNSDDALSVEIRKAEEDLKREQQQRRNPRLQLMMPSPPETKQKSDHVDDKGRSSSGLTLGKHNRRNNKSRSTTAAGSEKIRGVPSGSQQHDNSNSHNHKLADSTNSQHSSAADRDLGTCSSDDELPPSVIRGKRTTGTQKTDNPRNSSGPSGGRSKKKTKTSTTAAAQRKRDDDDDVTTTTIRTTMRSLLVSSTSDPAPPSRYLHSKNPRTTTALVPANHPRLVERLVLGTTQCRSVESRAFWMAA